jgi:hypothetical protein
MARASAASTVARRGGRVLLGIVLVVLATSGVAHAGATPDPAPQSGAGPSTGGPAPDPTPQAASQPQTQSSPAPRTDNPAAPQVTTTSSPVRSSDAGQAAARAGVLGVTVVRSTEATTAPAAGSQTQHKSLQSKRLALPSRRATRRSQAWLTAIAERAAAPWGRRNPIDALIGVGSPSASTPRDGLLLLLAAVALLIIMLASGSLLRLLTRMNTGSWAR